MIARRAVVVALLAGACSGGGPRPMSSTVAFQAVTEDGAPVVGATVAVDGRELGATDDAGALRVELSGREGTVFRPSARCPAPLASPEALPSITLRDFEPVAGSDEALVVSVRCERTQRLVGVLVRARAIAREPRTAPERAARRTSRAEAARRRLRTAIARDAEVEPLANVPILLKGKVVGKTDAHGLAHLAFETGPQSTFELALDAAAAGHPRLRPPRAVAHFEVRGADEVFIFDQSFVEELEPPPPPEPRKKKRRAPAPEPHKIKVYRDGEKAPLVEL